MRNQYILFVAGVSVLGGCAAPTIQESNHNLERVMPQLEVGRIYRAEDGRASYRYAGGGKLEKWGLERYFTPEPLKK